MNIKSTLIMLTGLVLAGCATTPGPKGFELIDDQSKTWTGSYDSSTQGMNVTLADGSYSGFYVVATDTVVTTAFPSFHRRVWPLESRGTVTSNIARAHLRNAAGGHLSCEFMFEASRAVGACKSPSGRIYQFVAGQ